MYQHKVIFICLLLLLLSTAASAKIVFSSERNGVEGIYVMDDDGSNQTLIIADKHWPPAPHRWSPEGKQIMFQISGGPISIMNADGTNVRHLTPHDGSTVGIASFSPDGKYIVFNRSFRKNDQLKVGIYVLNIKTLKMKEIHQSQLRPNLCDWSPDGKEIIFSEGTTIGGGGNTIWIIGADGQNPRRLIRAPVLLADNFVIHRNQPRWSPDGRYIVFTEREYEWKLWPGVGFSWNYRAYRYMICDRNGENIRKLRIPKDWKCYGIDWMDDGKSVVFSARQGMPLNAPPILNPIDLPPCYIYKYHIPTGEITQLTNDPGWDQILDWISDDVLSVTPQGKKKVTWGKIKEEDRKP